MIGAVTPGIAKAIVDHLAIRSFCGATPEPEANRQLSEEELAGEDVIREPLALA